MAKVALVSGQPFNERSPVSVPGGGGCDDECGEAIIIGGEPTVCFVSENSHHMVRVRADLYLVSHSFGQ